MLSPSPGSDIQASCAELVAYLQNHLPGFSGPCRIDKASGGQSNPTYVVTATSGRYVLRTKPAGPLLPSAHAIDREFRVLRALAGSAVPVPAPLLYCEDASIIGREFYVMQHIAGCVHWDPALREVAGSVRTRIYDEMNRALAVLHDLDVNVVGLSDFGRRSGFLERQVRRWTQQYRAAETERRPDVERLIDWVPRHLPLDDGQISLVHGDFRLDNLIFDEGGRLLGVLDWELSTLGHPYLDLGYLCAQLRLPQGELRGLKGLDRKEHGIASEDAFIAQYLERRRRPPQVSEWRFYLALSFFRMVAICQGVLRRGLDRLAPDACLQQFSRRVDIIASEALGILES